MEIRDAQIAPFRDDARERFEADMLAHAAAFAPELSRIVGEPGMRQYVHDAVDRAAGYGFTKRGPVQLFLELMLGLGTEFVTDPQLPWAARILYGQDAQETRARALYAEAQNYFEHTAGPGDRHILTALDKIRPLKEEHIKARPGRFEEQILQGLRSIYPEKCDYVGWDALDSLVKEGLQTAASFRLTADGPKVLIVALMFGLGHGVTADPLYPWVSATLKDERMPDPNQRARRLHEKTLIYIDHVRTNLA